MTTDTSKNADGTNQQPDGNKNGEGTLTLEQALERIKTVESNLNEVVSERDKFKLKVRKLEDTAGSAIELQKKYDDLFAEKSKLYEQHESITKELETWKTQARDQKIATELETAFTSAGAKSISTVMKLVDKNKIQFDEQGNIKADSISEIVKGLIESDPILFGNGEEKKGNQNSGNQELLNPGVKRAGDSGSTEDAFTKEIRAAKNAAEINAVLRKYGKL